MGFTDVQWYFVGIKPVTYIVQLGVDIVNKFVKIFPRVKHIGIIRI